MVFLLSGIAISGPAEVLFENSTTRCPRCGAVADIKDGNYNYFGEVLAVVQHSSPAALADLQNVLSRAESGALSQQEAAVESDAIQAGLGELVEFAFSKGLITFLLSFLALYLSWLQYNSSNSSTEEILKALHEIHYTNRLRAATSARGT